MSGNQQTNQGIDLDQYVQRLASMTEATTMFTLKDGAVVPHLHVGGEIIQLLMVEGHTLRNQVDRIAAEEMHWGRIAARQQRCATIRERQLRQWKAGHELEFRKECQDKGVKTTEAMVDAHHRTAPEYEVLQAQIEECQEAAMVADVIHRAFKSKKEVLKTDVFRAGDGTLQRLSP